MKRGKKQKRQGIKSLKSVQTDKKLPKAIPNCRRIRMNRPRQPR